MNGKESVASCLSMVLLLSGCLGSSPKDIRLPPKTEFLKQSPAAVLYQQTTPRIYEGMTNDELRSELILAMQKANADKAQIHTFCEGIDDGDT